MKFKTLKLFSLLLLILNPYYEKLLLLYAFLLFFFNQEVFAISGKISGKITDSSNTPMIGVNVLVKELGIGTVSDASGDYVISNIPAGRYTVEVTILDTQKLSLKTFSLIKIELHTKTFSSKRKHLKARR